MGRLKREVLGNGLEITYDYDRLSRVKELSLHDGSTVKYLYNAAYSKKYNAIKMTNSSINTTTNATTKQVPYYNQH